VTFYQARELLEKHCSKDDIVALAKEKLTQTVKPVKTKKVGIPLLVTYFQAGIYLHHQIEWKKWKSQMAL